MKRRTSPRSPAEIASQEAQRALAAKSAADVQAMHLARAFTPDERVLMTKALLAYAGMTPLEGKVRMLAEQLVRKMEGHDDEA